jgi:hypothetical protein
MLAKNVLQCNDMAKPFGKVVRDFLGLESTRESMEEVFKVENSPLKKFDDLIRIPAEEKIHIGFPGHSNSLNRKVFSACWTNPDTIDIVNLKKRMD